MTTTPAAADTPASPPTASDAAGRRGNHTPLPWYRGNGDIYAEGDKSSDFDDKVIAAIGVGGGLRSHEYAVIRAHKPEGRANAEFIVRACNNHYELLDALEWIAANYENGNLNHVDFRVQAKHRADAAIAKARGQ